MKKLTFILLIISLSSWGQNGMQTEMSGTNVWHVNYKNGKKYGVCYETDLNNGILYILGEYKNDSLVGTKYYFENGGLNMKFYNFRENKDSMTVKELIGVPDCLCDCETYYPSGMLESKGIVIFDCLSDPVVGEDYGIWKYYDENGNLLREEEHY